MSWERKIVERRSPNLVKLVFRSVKNFSEKKTSKNFFNLNAVFCEISMSQILFKAMFLCERICQNRVHFLVFLQDFITRVFTGQVLSQDDIDEDDVAGKL